MSILEVIKGRRSIRKFQKKEIPKEIIDKLIEALIWAPSAGNLQSRKFYFVFDQGIKEKFINEAGTQTFITQAPLVVVACIDGEITQKYDEKGRIYSICDAAMSIQNMMLLANDLGLGTVPVGAFDEKEISRILNLPSNLYSVLIIPVGYPAEKPKAPPRVSKEKAIKFVE